MPQKMLFKVDPDLFFLSGHSTDPSKVTTGTMVHWYDGTAGTMVLLVRWYCWYDGTAGTMVLLVRWYCWYDGTTGTMAVKHHIL